MKKSNVVEFSELLEHAETLGYKWNDACGFLDGVRPQYEVHTTELRLSEENEWREEFEWDEKAIEVIKSFMKKNKVNEITVVDD